MVLKFSGSGKQYKASGSPSFRSNRFHRSSRLAAYPGIIDESGFTSDGAGEAYSYMRTTTSAAPSSAWDRDKVNRGFRPPHVRSPSTSWIPSIIGEEEEEDDDDDADEEAVVLEEDRVPREWTAQVEPGVHITFVSIPGGAGNDLKRIRFSREMFNKCEAQRWWGENYDRVVELYNVQTFRQQGLSTPSSSVDDAMQLDEGEPGPDTASGSGEQQRAAADQPDRVVQGEPGGMLPVVRGRAGPVGPRVGAPPQPAQLRRGRVGRGGGALRPVPARHDVVPRRRGIIRRVREQRERAGGRGAVGGAGRAWRPHHHPRARRRHPGAPPRALQPGTVRRGAGQGLVGAEPGPDTRAVSLASTRARS
ncbi:protein Brevis radix-like 2 isoform X3 [Brachypodium distachyon]|nr:protein Brevis radix-like 2 isoform X3 [Brachypodium distachyon]XP_024317396.1 protein Brevis radix-like 2 isoform X3 [Brachypodium distachyon]|eukprot:XP_024317395.1 protein Brevis radix-like 2 isoform X3 [Brachypodium distachyon]